MTDYISRESALKAFKLTAKNPNKDYQRGMQDTIDCLVPEVIAGIPAADVQPVRHGRWIECCNEFDKKCSCCDKVHGTIYEREPFCPNCGARMDGDTE